MNILLGIFIILWAAPGAGIGLHRHSLRPQDSLWPHLLGGALFGMAGFYANLLGRLAARDKDHR